MPSDVTAATRSSPFLNRLPAWTAREIEHLYPGCFAFVMATGIISNTLLVSGHPHLSDLLIFINLAAYPLLLAMTLGRAARFPRALWSDLTNPRMVFSFLTFVAGSDVLGVGIYMRGFTELALALWLVALAAWFVLIYFSFGVLTFLNTAHGANVVHGGWLIAIVGTQSLVVLGSFVAPAAGAAAPSVFVLIHMLWGVGLALYAMFVVLFAYRIFFFDIQPDDITPLLWVVMGAAAISTNAGSLLIVTESGLPFLDAMRGFIDGITLILWAWATWWIPLLVLFGIWKHGICRVPLTYTPMLWSLVFPLGMYALASRRLSLAGDFALLNTISNVMLWISLAVWTATFAGLAVASWRGFVLAPPGAKAHRKK